MTRQRIATENIALARVNEGLELVRIGSPPRLELAGWRYGDQFGRRRRKYIVLTSAGLIASTLPLVGTIGFGASLGLAGGAISLTHSAFNLRRNWKALKVPSIFLSDRDGNRLPLTSHDTRVARLMPVHRLGAWYLMVKHRQWEPDVNTRGLVALLRGHLPEPRPAILEGEVAQRALGALLPHANPTGGSARRIREAVGMIESAPSMTRLIYQAAAISNDMDIGNALGGLPDRVRLALEMVVH